MPKTLRNVFYKKLDFIYFLNAHNRAKKSKAKKGEVIKFEMDLESNITNLIKEIKEKRYKIGKYHEFVVSYPKKRLIKSLPYKDRVVHQWYIEEFIKPYIIPRFINDTYACIENRGNHKAVLTLQKYMRIMKRKYGSYYILKCDVKKFFYSIDKDILFDILTSNINDKDLLYFTRILVDAGDDNRIGIPIGNYTSQYFANIYLNKLDHYIKDDLKVKYYIRYMDDFVLLLSDRKLAKSVYLKIENFLASVLRLSLNNKSCYFPNKVGVDFCGYKVYETHILVRKRCKRDIKKKVKIWNLLFLNKRLDTTKFLFSINSWKAHCNHANSYNLIKKIESKLLFKIN